MSEHLHPLEAEPTSIRPPFYGRGGRVEQGAGETSDSWRARYHAARVAVLVEALDGVELGAYDKRIIGWLAGWDVGTVGTIVSLLHRVRAAGAGSRADETGEA